MIPCRTADRGAKSTHEAGHYVLRLPGFPPFQYAAESTATTAPDPERAQSQSFGHSLRALARTCCRLRVQIDEHSYVAMRPHYFSYNT